MATLKINRQIYFYAIIIALLLLTVFLIDMAYYRFPSTIRLFSIEREIIIGVILLGIYQIIKLILESLSLKEGEALAIIGIIIGLTVAITILIYLFLSPYIRLWGDNPFLAEYPLVWNAFSLIMTFFIVVVVYLLLSLIYQLIEPAKPKETSKIVRSVLIGFIVIFSIGLNFIENRYESPSPRPVSPRTEYYFLIFAVIALISFIYLGREWFWFKKLRRRYKYYLIVGGVPAVLLWSILIISKCLYPVYVFSVTVKGFVVSSSVFILSFGLILMVKTLLSLLESRRSEQLLNQYEAIEYLHRSQEKFKSPSSLLPEMLKCLILATGSNNGWIEIDELDENYSNRFYFDNNMEIEAKEILPELSVTKNFTLSRPFYIVNNILKDNRTQPLEFVCPNWRSFMLVDIQNYLGRSAKLVLIKNYKHGFGESDFHLVDLILTKGFKGSSNLLVNEESD